MLQPGTKAPSFELPDQNGSLHTLEEYKGKKLILYFYPRDNTAGCTKQACGFSDRYPQFLEKGAVVVGISKDTVVTILADPALDAILAYDVWHEKKMAGKAYMGVVRTTYLIDEDGIIIRANDKVKAAADPQTMLDMLSDLE